MISEYFSAIKPSARDSFLPRDFLYFDEEKQGMVWMWALCEDMNDGGNEIIDFFSTGPDKNVLPYIDFQHCMNQAIELYKEEQQTIMEHCYSFLLLHDDRLFFFCYSGCPVAC